MEVWCDNNWSCWTCQTLVKLSPPTGQHPAFYRPDALPVDPANYVKTLKGTITAVRCLKCSKIVGFKWHPLQPISALSLSLFPERTTNWHAYFLAVPIPSFCWRPVPFIAEFLVSLPLPPPQKKSQVGGPRHT